MKEKLLNYGINFDEGVHRFSGNEALYEKFLLKFIDMGTMDELKESVVKQDFESMKALSHQLKGAVGNLSITILYDDYKAMNDKLKLGDMNVSAEWEKVCSDYDKVIEVLKEYRESK